LQTINFKRDQWLQKLQQPLGLELKNVNNSQQVIDGNFYICFFQSNTDVNLTDVIPLTCVNNSLDHSPSGEAILSSARQEIPHTLLHPAFTIQKRKACHLSLS
jgi:hypothetical protein